MVLAGLVVQGTERLEHTAEQLCHPDLVLRFICPEMEGEEVEVLTILQRPGLAVILLLMSLLTY